MTKFVAIVALALISLAPRAVAAQSALAGRWSTEFDIGIRNENGVETSMGKRQAAMTLILKGDSVMGTWLSAPADGAPSPVPIKLKGTVSGARVLLESEPVEHHVRINDDEQVVKMVSSYSFEVRGDSLVGTTRISAVDHSFDSPDRPFVAKRLKE
ncbi:MAG TPA: hypothetical protein VID74_04675 [Gemmatimonadales bacterium]|jgi:hypothetical protein